MEAIRFGVALKARSPRAFLLAAAFSALTLAACGGGDDNPTIGGGGGGGSTSGKAAIVMGDAAGDFYNYTVTLNSLKLVPASGTEVETLAAPIAIDFTQLQDLSQLLAVKDVPVGSYTSAHLVLDFSNSHIVVPDDAGNPSTLAPVNAAGAPLTTLDLVVKPASPLVIAQSSTMPIEFDFDIASSSIPDGSGNVIVLPLITATTTPSATRLHELAGQLSAASGNTLTVDLRPIGMNTGNLGPASVTVNDATVYVINGARSTGADGLTALNALTKPTPVAVFGSMGSNGSFTATQVNGGNTVGGNGVFGTVIARNGDTATVLGAVRDATHGNSFGNAVPVNLSGATVTAGESHGAATLATSDISIGSRIAVVGTCAAACSAGVTGQSVQLFPSRLDGTYVASADGADGFLVVNLADINGIPVNRFDFTGTSVDPSFQSNPQNYVVDSSATPVGTQDFGAQIQVLGFVSPYAAATGNENVKDFVAFQVNDAAHLPTRTLISWTAPGSSAALASSDPSSLVFDMADPQLGAFHHVYRLNQVIDLTQTGSNPTVNASGDFGGCALVDATARTITQFPTYAAFISALNTQLGGTAKLRAFGARGLYDDASVTVTADHCGAVIE